MLSTRTVCTREYRMLTEKDEHNRFESRTLMLRVVK